MSRTVRVAIAGVVSAGLLVVGAGAAFADSDDYDQDNGSADSSSAQSSGGGLGLGGLVSTDTVTGLLGGVTSGLGLGL
jgi:hypothetical protein